MIIDCTSCEMREVACGDCVIGVVFGDPAGSTGTLHLDPAEYDALGSLAEVGLVPALRHRHEHRETG